MNKIIKQLKEYNQDYEFYPTTKKMIEIIYNDYFEENKDYNNQIHSFSLLDIGAGNGNVFDIFNFLLPDPKDEYSQKAKITKFAIEKSEILINNMEKDIIIIGTDFEKQTLIDKKADIIFCNPPYSKYAEWTEKIIKECNCKYLYLIIPERWKKNKNIISLLNKRLDIKDYDTSSLSPEIIENLKNKEGYYKILDSMDFTDSEYRKARAKIDILKIKFSENKKNDPFDIFFEDNFKINAKKENSYNYKKTESKREKIQQLIKGRNIIECLVELYQKDLEKLLNNYKSLENLDYELFKELNINLDNLKTGLKEKITGLKNFYWKELFENLDKITNKLTSNSRKKMLDKLYSQTNIDFIESNIYALLIWILKNANQYIDDQLKEVYFDMADRDNIRLYKSNKKMIEDGWRYEKIKQTHFKLDYRLVFKRYNCFSEYAYEITKNLNNRIHDFINDIATIGYNLGFDNIDNSKSFQWSPGKENIFYYGISNNQEFMRVRCYKNGNVHIKFNQEFMKKLNIEMARLNGWIKNQSECSKELDIDIQEVEKYFNSNLKLIKSDIKLLTRGK